MERTAVPEWTPESLGLYAAREPVFPKPVSGVFRRLKRWLMGVTLAPPWFTIAERTPVRG